MIVPTSQSLTIWLAGDTIFAAIPPAPGHDKGHTVNFSADEFGLKNLLYVLKQRSIARDFERGIGHKGTPTQYDLEHIANRLMRDNPKRKATPPTSRPTPPTSRLTFDDLELDL